MAKLKKYDELNENKVSKDNVKSMFYILNVFKDAPETTFDFLTSLNLTEEQYKELYNIIDDFGSDKYNDGYTNCSQDEQDY